MPISWMKLGVVALLGSLALSSEADGRPPDDAPRLPVEEYVLANGLHVVLQADSRVPQVAVSLFVRAGSAHDPPRRSGFAHLFEHLVFQGSRHISKDVQDRLFVKIGSSDGAITRFDRTEFEMKGPSQHLETMLWLESDRLGFLAIGEKNLANQRDVVSEELRQEQESDPFWPADARLWGLIFPATHPYHRHVRGSHADLALATLEDVSRFYREHYVPANTSLVVVGAFEAGAARRLIEKYFGTLDKAPRPRTPSAAPGLKGGLVAREQMTGAVPRKRVSVAWLLPPAGDGRAAAAQLLVSILGSGAGSLLAREVIHGRKLAQDMRCTRRQMELASYLKCDFFLAAPDRAPEPVIEAVRAAVAGLADRGVDDRVLRAAKMGWKVDLLRDVESLRDRAILLNQYVVHHGAADRIAEEWRRVDAVDGAAIQRMAREYLVEGRQAVVTVAPAGP